jgi:sterol desaturase/sphingolipid hydroxylase (fatty acid hydroxylase superfamily)
MTILILIATGVATVAGWTFMMYWIHRAAHVVPWMQRWHVHHHAHVMQTVLRSDPDVMTWKWNNIFLYNDTWDSTVDFWITDVIPTVLFVLITGQLWFGIAYYLYSALLQERVEHNPRFSYYPFTPGQWHLDHHSTATQNYGIWFPVWDIVFGTNYART